MKRVDYDERLHAVYARGRAMVPSAIDTWLAAFERRWSDQRPLTLLDLGSGTGRWTPHLAARFGGPVYGVEPSDKMRAVATANAAHEQVAYLAGSGESIPLDDASCDGALAFFVWHFVALDEVAAVTAETRRQDLDRLQLRALSTFEHLTEAEVDAGFAALEASLADGAGAVGPIVTIGDLLVLERPQ